MQIMLLAADYDLNKVFHIQGEYILWQCSIVMHRPIVMMMLFVRW